MNPNDIERESGLQAEAERAERAGLPATGDAAVDRYRLVVRALREPPDAILPAGFAARVAAIAERTPSRAAFEERLTGILLCVLGLVALLFAGGICIDALRVVLLQVRVTPGLQPVAAAVACIALVAMLDRAWTRRHPMH